ncbi:hypothetical protein FPOAC2_12563 [Fusarium poae]|jgi:hypothetical protein
MKSGEPRATITSFILVSFLSYSIFPKAYLFLHWPKFIVSCSTLSLNQLTMSHIELSGNECLAGGLKMRSVGVEDCLFQPPTANHDDPPQPYSVQKYLCDVLPTYVQINCLSSSFDTLRLATLPHPFVFAHITNLSPPFFNLQLINTYTYPRRSS